jgi:8-oxo-dGTP diphosphatase
MPEATVAAIVARADPGGPQILLTRRNVQPFKGQWCLPGGHVDPYEPIRDAVIREVKEETGLDYEAALFQPFDEIVPERGIHAVVMVFCGPATGSPHASEAEVSEMKWFPISEAVALPLAFTHNEVLEAYMAACDTGPDPTLGEGDQP